jgi:hypothetical protein
VKRVESVDFIVIDGDKVSFLPSKPVKIDEIMELFQTLSINSLTGRRNSRHNYSLNQGQAVVADGLYHQPGVSPGAIYEPAEE